MIIAYRRGFCHKNRKNVVHEACSGASDRKRTPPNGGVLAAFGISGEDGLQGSGQNVLLSLGLGQILAQGGEVGLDLGLGAGGTDDDGGAAFQGVDQDVGCRQAGCGGVSIVNDLGDSVAADLSQGLLTQTCHDACHLVHAAETGELKRVNLVQVAAVLGIDGLQTLLDGGADGAVVGSHLADQHGADDGVLVADVGAAQVAVGFFEAQDETLDFTGSFQTGDLIADLLETGQHIAHLNAIVCSHRISQRSRNQRLDSHGVLGHGALLNAAFADVVQQQNAHFVAGDQLVGAVGTLHGDANAVGIGVGGQHQVSAGLGGQLQAQLQSLEDLGVGVGAGGEVAVGVLLLGNDGDVIDADVVQDAHDGNQTGAVQGGVD